MHRAEKGGQDASVRSDGCCRVRGIHSSLDIFGERIFKCADGEVFRHLGVRVDVPAVLPDP